MDSVTTLNVMDVKVHLVEVPLIITVCTHTFGGEKSNDPQSPVYVPSIFDSNKEHFIGPRAAQILRRYRGATLNIPAFTKGKSQLAPGNVEATCRLSNIRIHVERVIGAVRQRFKILSATTPLPMHRVYQV